MDKVRIKGKLNFKNEINPLLTIFNKVENKARKVMLWNGMIALKNDTHHYVDLPYFTLLFLHSDSYHIYPKSDANQISILMIIMG